MENKYITVLDFEINRVFQYDLDYNELEKYTNDIQFEDYEEFLGDKGHNLTNCEWMSHEDKRIMTNLDVTRELITN